MSFQVLLDASPSGDIPGAKFNIFPVPENGEAMIRSG
jgi:hypothetical protein